MGYAVYAQEWARAIMRDPGQLFYAHTKRHCPLCGFTGNFINAGSRLEARCPKCASKERDRSIGLFLARNNIDVRGKNILHFSAERPFFRKWKRFPGYVAGDIKKSRVANAMVDITKIQFPDEHFDLIICNHVLEHVPDDAKGMAECFRVLKKNGTAIFSVPMDVTKHDTWEPPAGMPTEEVDRICGHDHKRIYGQDFIEKLATAGFKATPLQYNADEVQKYRLCEEKEERIYIATRS